MIVKRVATIQDLSGFGRASLTTIIPILSTMGVQVCPVPTAILSTHTGGFGKNSFIDLTEYMREHINHWKELKLEFSCIYSGFLGSPSQIDIVEGFIDSFGEKCECILIDPVMGDNGKLYKTMDNNMVEGMKRLIKKADIITPNYTELCYLLGKEMVEDIPLEELKKYLKELSLKGPKIVIVTSIPTKNNKMCVIAYDRENDNYWKVENEYIPASYPGTGDAYASVLIGSILQGDSLPVAMERASQFIFQAIKRSYGYNYETKEGILLEKTLGILNSAFILNNYEKI